MLGDLKQGVVQTTDTGGFPPSMLDAIAEVGGLWHAGDYYAKPDAIVRTAREHGVRALRVDARNVSWLGELPDLEFLHLRTDGRPPLDPVRSLGQLRGLMVEVGAVRGTIDLEAHPDPRWLKITLSGKGGAANLRHILAGHPGVEHLRSSEIPFGDLAELATAFPSVRFFETYGADRLNLAPLRALPSLIALGGEPWIGRPVDGIPCLQDLQRDDRLRLEWQRAANG